MNGKNIEGSKSLGVGDFFKKTGRIKQRFELEEEMQKYVDPKTNLVYKDLTEHRNCINCGTDDYRIAFIKGGNPYCICNNCSLMYVTPILNSSKLTNTYRDSNSHDNWFEVLISEDQRKFDEPKFLNGLEACKKILCVPKLKILDIGCASGHFIELANKQGHETYGIELTKKAVDYCKSKGLNVIDKELCDGLFNTKFDLITYWDVIEHLPNPSELMEITKNMLNDGGLVLCLVPNADSLAAKIMHEKTNMFTPNVHINIFTKKTLESFMSNNGFKSIYFESQISEMNVINNYLNYKPPYEVNDFNTTILGLINEKDILDNFLGYKILGIFEKKD